MAGLWVPKAVDAKKAVYRLEALAERKVCAPQTVAALIEQSFTIEEPMIWHAAAESLGRLRQMDPKIQIASTARIVELIARDPAKNGKYLKKLLQS